MYYIEGAEPESVQHSRFPVTMMRIDDNFGGDVFALVLAP
jgi:hypothetical protein